MDKIINKSQKTYFSFQLDVMGDIVIELSPPVLACRAIASRIQCKAQSWRKNASLKSKIKDFLRSSYNVQVNLCTGNLFFPTFFPSKYTSTLHSIKLQLEFLLSSIFFGLHNVGVLWGVGTGGLDLFPPPWGPGGGGQGPGDP